MTEVRRVRAEEWEALRDVRLRALGDAPLAFSTTLAEAKLRNDAWWREAASRGARGDSWITFVADEDGRLVGMATGLFPDEDLAAPGDPSLASLMQMWVAPEARRGGIGRRLVERVLAWADDRGARTVRLNVVLAVPGAIAFYRSLGFRDTGRRDPVSAERDDLEMEMERPCRI